MAGIVETCRRNGSWTDALVVETSSPVLAERLCMGIARAARDAQSWQSAVPGPGLGPPVDRSSGLVHGAPALGMSDRDAVVWDQSRVAVAMCPGLHRPWTAIEAANDVRLSPQEWHHADIWRSALVPSDFCGSVARRLGCCIGHDAERAASLASKARTVWANALPALCVAALTWHWRHRLRPYGQLCTAGISDITDFANACVRLAMNRCGGPWRMVLGAGPGLSGRSHTNSMTR